MVDKELLSRKISRLRSYLEELKSGEDIDWGKYQSDSRAKAFAERYLLDTNDPKALFNNEKNMLQ